MLAADKAVSYPQSGSRGGYRQRVIFGIGRPRSGEECHARGRIKTDTRSGD
jgi:hypothetical protein